MLIYADDSNFEELILNSNEKVLIDFYADWCMPCQMLAPIIEEIAKDYKVCKINVDKAPQVAAAFKIESIPTLAVIENKRLLNLASGYMEKEAVLKLL